jgi:hypothetical protein
MKRAGMLQIVIAVTILCLVLGESALFAGQPQGPNSRKMRGTWSSLVVVPPNDILGNTEPVFLPELDTFTHSRTSITSSSATILPVETDQGSFLTATGIGQGNWKFEGGRFIATQWRFISDVSNGQPLGYLRMLVEWQLLDNNSGEGSYRVEIFQLDMTTPYTSGGSPIMIEGPFTIWRLPIEPLP